MQIEVNEENIVKFNLVQLTGNSVEALLKAAAEAAESGYILTCQIPDDDSIHVNVFDAVNGEKVSDEDLKHWTEVSNPIVDGQRQRREIRDEHGNLVGVQFEPGPAVVQGEVIASRDEKE